MADETAGGAPQPTQREETVARILGATRSEGLSAAAVETFKEALQAEEKLIPRALKQENLVIARLVVGPTEYLNADERADLETTEAEKMTLSYRRFGEQAGRTLKLFEGCGLYNKEQIDSLEWNISDKASRGGLATTEDNIAAINAMELDEERRKKWMVAHYVNRAIINPEKFAETKDDDLRQIQEQIGQIDKEELEGLMKDRIFAIAGRQYSEVRKHYVGSKGFGEAMDQLGLDKDKVIAEATALPQPK